jgi:hypothetical protein
LEEVNREYKAVSALKGNEQAGEVREGTELDTHCIAGCKIGPRLRGARSGNDCLQRRNFCIWNWGRKFSDPNEVFHADTLQNWKALFYIQAAKGIAREKGSIHFLDPVRIATGLYRRRQEKIVAFVG